MFIPKKLVMVLFAVGFSLGIISAESFPRLEFAWHHNMDDLDMVNASSLIVIAKVGSINFVGVPRQGQDDTGDNGDWQLVKVDTSVENVLKGTVTATSLQLYFYTSLGGTSGDVNSLHVGLRYVFFISEQRGVFRAVRDYWRSSIEVGSGRHTDTHESNATIQERIAFLLLTPGTGVKPKAFAFSLTRAVPLARNWIGPCKTVGLLQALLKYPNVIVENAAREELDTAFSNLVCP